MRGAGVVRGDGGVRGAWGDPLLSKPADGTYSLHLLARDNHPNAEFIRYFA
jgi:hypothetical protein